MSVKIESEKISEDKKDIEMEEREKMLNEANKEEPAVEKKGEGGGGERKTIEETKTAMAKQTTEGMEVKPKKIPIGGIQMPGFFTRNKPKDEEVTEGVDLIEAKTSTENSQTSQQPASNTSLRIKLPNPFRRSRVEDPNAATTLTTPPEDDESKTPADQRRTTNLLNQIRIPIESVLVRMKRDQSSSGGLFGSGGAATKEGDNDQQPGKADLASMETLGDNKSTDETSRSNGGGGDGEAADDLKDVPLGVDVESGRYTDDRQRWTTACWEKIKKCRLISLLIISFVILLFIVLIWKISAREFANRPIIRDGRYVETITSCGRVEGLLEDSSYAFRGIPYARPPLGVLRFRNAYPLNNIAYCWNGTFKAYSENSTTNTTTTPSTSTECLQILANGTTVGREDCLTLDVITPRVVYDNPLPVVVLVGAESLMGGSPGQMRPSARYARAHDVVFVRPRFRLGVLGFLALDHTNAADGHDVYPPLSGNYGLSDLREALRWVQLNIEHFGGDKNAVTVFGHRAGATLVTALATVRNAGKLFKRGWVTSGGALYPKKTLQEAAVDMESFMRIVECDSVECLRDMDAEKLINAVEDTWRKPQPDIPAATEQPDKRHEWLILDGDLLREHPAEVWAKQNLSVDLVIGTTAHVSDSEFVRFKATTWTNQTVAEYLNASFLREKHLVADVLDLYPATYAGLASIISDIRTVCPLYAITTQMAATHTPFYVVLQTRRTPEQQQQQHDAQPEVADINSDVDAILGRYVPKTPQQRRYINTMQSLFYHYVWHGKVQKFENYGKRVLLIDQDIVQNATYTNCAFWINKNIVLPYAALD